MISIFLAIVMMRQPDLDGLATYYYEPGVRFRNEEMFDNFAPVCAVDGTLWNEMKGKTLLVQSVRDNKFAVCVVKDSGRLSSGGDWRQSRRTWKRWLRPDDADAIGPIRRNVVDIPQRMFLESFGDLETRHVRAWVVQ